jgi:hypothetical protein
MIFHDFGFVLNDFWHGNALAAIELCFCGGFVLSFFRGPQILFVIWHKVAVIVGWLHGKLFE